MTKPLLTGVLKTWKEDRGFGFITPDNGSRDVFIHISALGETSRRPIPGDTIRYQLVRDRNGKFRAINANIEGVTKLNQSTEGAPKVKSKTVWLIASIIVLLAVISAAVFVYRSGGFNQ